MEVRSQLSTNPRYNNDRRASQRTKTVPPCLNFSRVITKQCTRHGILLPSMSSSKSECIVLMETVWQKTRRGEEND